MPDHDENPVTVNQIFDAAPEVFGLAWEYSRRVKGERELCIAQGHTEAYTEAYRLCRQELRDVGFSNAEPFWGDTFRGTRPCFWMTAAGWSPAAVDAVVALVPVRRLEEEAREAAWKAEEEAERLYASKANERLIEGARTAARESLRDRRWSWAKAADIEEAGALLANPDLTIAEARRLHDMVDRARANLARAEARIATPYLPELELARYPTVRAAAMEGCLMLTARDADWASVRNASGWSKATTVTGHVLAGQESLDETKASHALRLLRIHRKQLPSDLTDRLFGGLAVAA